MELHCVCISKCKCAPVVRPEFPVFPIRSPLFTCSPTLVEITLKWAYLVSYPLSCLIIIIFPYPLIFPAKVTTPALEALSGTYLATKSTPVCNIYLLKTGWYLFPNGLDTPAYLTGNAKPSPEYETGAPPSSPPSTISGGGAAPPPFFAFTSLSFCIFPFFSCLLSGYKPLFNIFILFQCYTF